MDTRLNKYYEDEEEVVTSRTKKNENLYKEISKNELDNFEIKSNSTVIGENKAEIDVEKIKKILDTRYNEVPKRKSIRLEPSETEEEKEKEITKEYDINVVLEKAKENKNENYEEERLKQLKNTQYDILNSLKISKEDKKEPEIPKSSDLEELINTIAFNEKTVGMVRHYATKNEYSALYQAGKLFNQRVKLCFKSDLGKMNYIVGSI